jgi:hypothetical protein
MDIARKQFSAYDHENKTRDWEHVRDVNMEGRDEINAGEMSSGAPTVACLGWRLRVSLQSFAGSQRFVPFSSDT